MEPKGPKKTILPLALDQATEAWLKKLSRATGDPPADMILSMLHQIRLDDEAAHGETPPTSNSVH